MSWSPCSFPSPSSLKSSTHYDMFHRWGSSEWGSPMGIARVVYRARESNTATSISTAPQWCHNASESHIHLSSCLLFDFWKVANFSTLNTASIKPPGKMASLVAQLVKSLPTMKETWVWFLGRKDSLENRMATHSSIPAWRIPQTKEPGRLQSMGRKDSAMTNHFHFFFIFLQKAGRGVRWSSNLHPFVYSESTFHL